MVTERQAVREMIAVLQTAYFFDAVETGGVLVFRKRGAGDNVAIDALDLGAADGDGDRSRIRVERTQDTELPIAVEHAATRFVERQGRTLTHRTIHADGRVRYFESMIEVLEEDGAYLGVVFNARDVTERIEERARLEREVAFSRSLVALTNELLAARLDARFHQHALERAIALVPDAQGGSMLLRDGDDDRYGYVAAVGFDLEALRTLRLTQQELGRSDPPRVERLRVAQQIAQLGPEPLAMLRGAGRLDAILTTLCVPIVVAGAPRGYLNLDNFEDAEAFGEDAHAIAPAISAQVAVALQRLTLESDLQRERERYERLAAHDPLTGLPNRRLFQDQLEQALAQAQRGGRALAVAYVDLDGFKAVNDARGHDAGDAALRLVMQFHEIGIAEKGCETFGAKFRLVGNDAVFRNGGPCVLEGDACIGAEGGDRAWCLVLVSGTDTHDHLRPPLGATCGRGGLWSPPLNGS